MYQFLRILLSRVMSYRVRDKTDVDNDVIVPFHLRKTTIKFTLIIEDLPYKPSKLLLLLYTQMYLSNSYFYS